MFELLGPIIGGLLGSDEQEQSRTTRNEIDPRIASHLYGEDGNGGLLGRVRGMYEANPSGLNPQILQGMNAQWGLLTDPSVQAGYQHMRETGRAGMSLPFAGNPFTQPGGYNRAMFGGGGQMPMQGGGSQPQIQGGANGPQMNMGPPSPGATGGGDLMYMGGSPNFDESRAPPGSMMTGPDGRLIDVNEYNRQIGGGRGLGAQGSGNGGAPPGGWLGGPAVYDSTSMTTQSDIMGGGQRPQPAGQFGPAPSYNPSQPGMSQARDLYAQIGRTGQNAPSQQELDYWANTGLQGNQLRDRFQTEAANYAGPGFDAAKQRAQGLLSARQPAFSMPQAPTPAAPAPAPAQQQYNPNQPGSQYGSEQALADWLRQQSLYGVG